MLISARRTIGYFWAARPLPWMAASSLYQFAVPRTKQNLAAFAGAGPIVLSLVQVMVGRKRMFLLTNELTLTEKQLADIDARRWGVEVFFRTVKQSLERAKLLSRTPENAKQEIHWTLLGVWLALTEGCKHIPRHCRLSPIRVLRTLYDLVTNVARYSM